jgi:GntR family transcriptional regulator/MocR family aminotransferase
LRLLVVCGNIRTARSGYDHFGSVMRRVSSGLSPLLAVSRKGRTPLHRQIYDAYRTMIVDGRLRPGQQLPSTRALTTELRISRVPLLTAYAQLLAEGYFETRKGAGTFVCRSLPDVLLRPEGLPRLASAAAATRSISKRASRLPPYEPRPWFGLGPFSVSQPASEDFPLLIWSNLVARHCRNLPRTAFSYGESMGFEPLRDAVANYLTTARGVRCDAQQIMVVSGSQQALEISARVLTDPGDPVWVEEPGYWLARIVLQSADCRLVPVPVDNEGIKVSVGLKRCRKARAAYVAPSHQYPLGVTMSASRRLQLLDWAQTSGSWIVEDDYDSEFRYESMPIASLQGLDTSGRVVYVGTFSKVLFPSLRLGYAVIPKDLVPYFVAARRTIDIAPAYLQQAALTDFIREGHFARHIRRMRTLYDQRRAALVDCIHHEFGTRLEVLGSEAGMHLLIGLPRGMDDVEIAQRAAREKLWLAPLSPYYIGKVQRRGFVLGFGGVATSEVPDGVRRLRRILSL